MDCLDKFVKPISQVAAPILKHVVEDKKNTMDPKLQSALLAPVHFAEGNKVHAAVALSKALKFEELEPVFGAVDMILKTDRPASAEDYFGVRILKHRTTSDAGKAIATSQEMRPGKEGVLGAGIYFATNEEATEVKAVHGTVQTEPFAMVTASVKLGNVRMVKTGEREWRMICDGGFDKTNLQALNYQSVASYFNGGWEFCVFDPKRVAVLDVHQYTAGEKCSRGNDKRKSKVCVFHDPQNGTSCHYGNSCHFFHMDTHFPELAKHHATVRRAYERKISAKGKGDSPRGEGKGKRHEP